MSRVPPQLRAGILAVLALTGGGVITGVGVNRYDAYVQERHQSEYVQAVAADKSTSTAVKVAMVMGSYYESSYKHIGTPYVDRLGKGQPWTVCNGITGQGVVPGRYYTPADCYALERGRYIAAEKYLIADVGAGYTGATLFQQAVMLDFQHNKGPGNWATSTYRRLVLAGDAIGACRQNERWTRGTVEGVSTVLPGLVTRANANSDLCAEGLP